MSFFVTATDTDAGKTYISRLIIEALRREGLDWVGYKPVVCGDRGDAIELALAAGENQDALDAINPLWLKTPAAPHVACMLEGVAMDFASLIRGYDERKTGHDGVIVEGAGGWLVPMTRELMMADLVSEMGLPVLLVVKNQLGALNHTMLTVESMRARGVEPAGLIFNHAHDELDTAAITNKGIIEDLCGVEVLTDVIRGQEEIEAWPFLDLIEAQTLGK